MHKTSGNVLSLGKQMFWSVYQSRGTVWVQKKMPLAAIFSELGEYSRSFLR
jgi:hypothetical protein